MKLFWLVNEVYLKSVNFYLGKIFYPKSLSVHIETHYFGPFCVHLCRVAATCETTGQGTDSLF
jgi:hypothetical protein